MTPSPALMAAAVEASRTEKLLAVALRYGVPLTTLCLRRKELGLTKERRRFDHAAALCRRDAGETLAAIAADYGVTVQAVAHAVKLARGA